MAVDRYGFCDVTWCVECVHIPKNCPFMGRPRLGDFARCLGRLRENAKIERFLHSVITSSTRIIIYYYYSWVIYDWSRTVTVPLRWSLHNPEIGWKKYRVLTRTFGRRHFGECGRATRGEDAIKVAGGEQFSGRKSIVIEYVLPKTDWIINYRFPGLKTTPVSTLPYRIIIVYGSFNMSPPLQSSFWFLRPLSESVLAKPFSKSKAISSKYE